MRRESIDASTLQKMIIAGANRLDANKQMVNDLNVFPVPDGDTGTNMSLTILAAAKEVGNIATEDVYAIAKAASSGSLRGARGNSGVILSQLVRGFSRGLEAHPVIDGIVLANAMKKGADTAYKAVMKPKEGTILTVAREMASKAVEIAPETGDIVELLTEVIKHGRETLNQTPEMLPVLKEAGVVDAGGEGLMCILEGALAVLTGEEVELVYVQPTPQIQTPGHEHFHNFNVEDITFGYCTEFIVNRNDSIPYDENQLKEFLSKIGDSIVVVSDEDYIKVHVHTDHPGQALEKAITLGSLSNIKIDNMREQHESLVTTPKVSKPEEKISLGFISIAAGDGIAEIMKTLGVTQVIQGGQTMNPSTDDILGAIENCNAETVIIFPNNKNILLAAEQAAKLTKDTTVYVIPTKTIPQGISAMISYNPNADIKTVLSDMQEAIMHVKTGQITYAVRDTTIEGKEIKAGNFLGILDDNIAVVGHTLDDTAKELIEAMVDEDSEIISLYYGSDVSTDEVETLEEFLEETYTDYDIEVHSGDQPVYYYIISVE